jgi:hypothetical protein
MKCTRGVGTPACCWICISAEQVQALTAIACVSSVGIYTVCYILMPHLFALLFHVCWIRGQPVLYIALCLNLATTISTLATLEFDGAIDYVSSQEFNGKYDRVFFELDVK